MIINYKKNPLNSNNKIIISLMMIKNGIKITKKKIKFKNMFLNNQKLCRKILASAPKKRKK